MTICIIASQTWLRSTFNFAVANFIVTCTLKWHFKTIPDDYYVVVATTICLLGISCYSMEFYNRNIYMMYKNMQILENKHSTILNLYPESLAIVNLVNKQFIYFNKSFDSLFHAS